MSRIPLGRRVAAWFENHTFRSLALGALLSTIIGAPIAILIADRQIDAARADAAKQQADKKAEDEAKANKQHELDKDQRRRDDLAATLQEILAYVDQVRRPYEEKALDAQRLVGQRAIERGKKGGHPERYDQGLSEIRSKTFPFIPLNSQYRKFHDAVPEDLRQEIVCLTNSIETYANAIAGYIDCVDHNAAGSHGEISCYVDTVSAVDSFYAGLRHHMAEGVTRLHNGGWFALDPAAQGQAITYPFMGTYRHQDCPPQVRWDEDAP